ncbi:MAG: sugar-binding protein [Elusimicrobiota bacterium]|jgi:putative multiple sugar transport system substrate-binding protein|nr:sugar-binding protein [Elusimicrobiota bacterium]
MVKLHKIVILLFAAAFISACGNNIEVKHFVGVSMPTKDLERWSMDGENLEKQLKKLDYKVSVQYAQNEVSTQVSQIENLIALGVNVLIIAPIDGEALTTVLTQAAEKNIKVIAYDRLIKNTPHVDYYVTFDNFKVGELEGRIIEKGLGLDSGNKGPFNVEIFSGAPDDNNAYFFFNGAMQVLKPYIDAKIIVTPSGQVGWPKYGIEQWSNQKAQERMTNILSAFYTSKKVDAVLSPNDAVAYGIISALKGAGYAPGDSKKPFPVISGQDCDRVNIKAILNDEQTASVFKDTRILAEHAVSITKAIFDGLSPEVNDSKTYNNGVKIVPSYLCEPIIVYKDNIKSALLDSGYYKESDLK